MEPLYIYIGTLYIYRALDTRTLDKGLTLPLFILHSRNHCASLSTKSTKQKRNTIALIHPWYAQACVVFARKGFHL